MSYFEMETMFCESCGCEVHHKDGKYLCKNCNTELTDEGIEKLLDQAFAEYKNKKQNK